MSPEKSFVSKVEQNVDDLGKVRKRKPWLFYLIVAGFVIFGVLYVFEKFWGIPRLKEQLSNQQKQIDDLTRDRDAKATQLAPFLAAANRNFGQAPEDQRLELLLRRLNDAAINLETTASKLGKERVWQEAEARATIEGLKRFTNWRVEIELTHGDHEAANLAKQYQQIFNEAGWKVGGLGNVIDGRYFKGISVEFGSIPELEMQSALVPLWTTFGYLPNAVTNNTIPPQTMKIRVGHK